MSLRKKGFSVDSQPSHRQPLQPTLRTQTFARLHTRLEFASHNKQLPQLLQANRSSFTKHERFLHQLSQQSFDDCRKLSASFKTKILFKHLTKVPNKRENYPSALTIQSKPLFRFDIKKYPINACHIPKFGCSTKLVTMDGGSILLGGYFCERNPTRGLGIQLSLRDKQVRLSQCEMRGDYPPQNLIGHEVSSYRNQVALFGGYLVNPETSKRFNNELFLCVEKSWRRVKTIHLLSARRNFSMHLLQNQTILLGGFSEANCVLKTIDVVNLNSGSAARGESREGYAFQRSCLVCLKEEDFIFAFGGVDQDDQLVGRMRYLRLEQQDNDASLASYEWTTLRTQGLQAEPRKDHTMEYLRESQSLLVIGGKGDRGVIELDMSIVVLSLLTNTWTRPMLQGHRFSIFGHTSLLLGSQVVLFGGYNQDSQFWSGVLAIETERVKQKTYVKKSSFVDHQFAN